MAAGLLLPTGVLAQFPARRLIFRAVIRPDRTSVAATLVQVDQFFAYVGIMLPGGGAGLPQVACAVPFLGRADRMGRIIKGSCFAAFDGLQRSRRFRRLNGSLHNRSFVAIAPLFVGLGIRVQINRKKEQ